MTKFLVTAAMVMCVCCAAPAFSQTPRAEIFGGYSWARQGGVNISKGWNGSVAGNINRWLSVEGDLSGHYEALDTPGTVIQGNISFLSYRFGPKFSFRSEDSPVTPFAHFLVGGVRTKITGSGSVLGTNFNVSQSSNDLASLIGGGIDIGKGSIAIRAIQADYSAFQVIDPFGVSIRANGVRLSTGVVFRLR
jgi:Outer membrane protein beta-barrel domain